MSATSDSEDPLALEHKDGSGARTIDPFTEYGYQEIPSDHFKAISSAQLHFDGAERIFNPFALNDHSSEYQWRQRILKNLSVGEGCQSFMRAVASHRDVLYFKERPDETHDLLLQTLAAHTLNRLLGIRDRIIKTNMRMAQDESGRTEDIRDQGFTRPRVLILVPFKNTAFKLVSAMIAIWESKDGKDCTEGKEGQVEQKKRFMEEYGKYVDSDGEHVGNEDLSGKPDDYQHNFAGNIDDCFRIGMKMTRKALKLYSDFYSSDILIASPLGLKLTVDGQDGARTSKETKSRAKKARTAERRSRAEKHKAQAADHDFLSSIESVIVDQADILCMQNWDHVEEVFGKLNCLPKNSHGCDFSRVLSVFLDGHAKHCRQTILLSAFPFPELHALVQSHCHNVFGAIKFEDERLEPCTRLSRLKPEMHHFTAAAEPLEEAESRFQYFVASVLNNAQKQSHTAIVVSNYFEFLKVKQHLDTVDGLTFECVCEYSDHKQVTRARSRFHDGHVRLLLLTERFFFFHRFAIKGIRKLLMYSLPTYPVLFKELAEMVQVREGVKVAPVILVSPLDRLKMERIFGSKEARRLLPLPLSALQ